MDNISKVISTIDASPDIGIEQAFALFGQHGLLEIPEDFSKFVMNYRSLSQACPDFKYYFSINAHIWGVLYPVYKFSTNDYHKSVLESLMSGKSIGAVCISEEDCGSDVSNITTRVEKVGDHFILSGKKDYITNLTVAQYQIVYARYDKRISGFIVKTDSEGISFKEEEKRCHDGISWGSVTYDKVKLDEKALLGKEGRGLYQFFEAVSLEKSLGLAYLIGLLESELKKCQKTIAGKKRYGSNLLDNDFIINKLAALYSKIEICKVLLDETARRSNKSIDHSFCSIAKDYISQANVEVIEGLAHLQGAKGFLSENLIYQRLIDAYSSKIFCGTSEIQKKIIFKLM